MSDKQQYDADYYKGAQFSNVGDFTYEDNLANSSFNLQITEHMMRSIGQRLFSLLDVGASGGFFVRHAIENGINAYGQELSEWAVANSCLPEEHKGRLTTMPVEELAKTTDFGDGRYDCITSWFVMEHIPRPQLEQVMVELAELSDFFIFRVPLLNTYETPEERASYDPDPTHVNVWGFDDWRKFLWNETDWYLINAHYSDFAVEGGPGPIGTFFCTSNENLYHGILNQGPDRLLEMFPFGNRVKSQYISTIKE